MEILIIATCIVFICLISIILYLDYKNVNTLRNVMIWMSKFYDINGKYSQIKEKYPDDISFDEETGELIIAGRLKEVFNKRYYFPETPESTARQQRESDAELVRRLLVYRQNFIDINYIYDAILNNKNI